MRITNVRHWTQPLSLTRPYEIAYAFVDSVTNYFVKIETSDGLFGMGAASPEASVTGEGPEACDRALSQHLEPLLKGEDIRHLRIVARNLEKSMKDAPAARAAVDMALWDLAAKKAGVPLARLLGRVHHSLPTSITLGIQSIADALAEADEFIGKGFFILKIKTGKDPEADVELLHRLREHVGKKILIRVDANQGYSSSEYLSFFNQTKELGLEFVEQPLAAKALDEMRKLPREVRLASMADESLLSPFDAMGLSHPPLPFGTFNIKLMKCGGVTPALQIALVAELSKIGLMWGCMDESALSISAALHTALACPATRYLDLDGSLDIDPDPVSGGFVIKNGIMGIMEDKPGLGIVPEG